MGQEDGAGEDKPIRREGRKLLGALGVGATLEERKGKAPWGSGLCVHGLGQGQMLETTWMGQEWGRKRDHPWSVWDLNTVQLQDGPAAAE